MDLTYLQNFCVAVREGSISEAARLLHLSQSALSLQVQTLENHFGAQLLERTNRGVEPTLAGKIVFEFASTVLELKQNVESEIKELTKGSRQRLSVGASDTLGGYALPCSLVLFRELHPDIVVDLVIDNCEKILNRLFTRSLEMALAEGPRWFVEASLTDKLRCTELGREDVYLVTPYSEPWLSIREVSASDLCNFPLILRERGSGIRESVEAALQTIGCSPEGLQVILELGSTDAIKSAIQAGHGISLLPQMAIRSEIGRATIKALPLAGFKLTHAYYMIHPPASQRNPALELFLQFMMSSEDRGFC